ncbi:MAG: ABC transporter permease subunit [Chloroflexi bacterium]|nr:ABC transporter permease subunit [Chloroflexota bacterium]
MAVGTQEISLQQREPTARESLLRPLVLFFRALRRTPIGFIGFIGVVFYALLISVGPLIVPFDSEVRLDQIAAPPGSRVQLLTRAADVDRYRTLDDLAGQTVGVVRETAGPDLVAPYEAAGTFAVDETRWRSGRGVPQAMEDLVDGEIDALIVFSESVRRYITENRDAAQAAQFSGLAVSNEALGPPYIFGTDTQGRDIFSHIVNGGTILIVTAVLAGFLSTLIAVGLGALAALTGGFIDRGLTAIANFVLTIPQFPLLVVLAALVQLNNFMLLALLIALLSWPVLMRAIRAQVLSLRERDYVEAAIALNLGRPHIILREILPNMMSFVVINFIFAVTSAMYQQVGLVFLGMAPINDYTWGVMLYFGRTRGTLFSADSAMMVLAPVVAIALFQVSMVLFARAVEEMFDPRLRTVS